MKKTSYDLECTPSIEVSRYDVERSPDVVAHRNTPSGERLLVRRPSPCFPKGLQYLSYPWVLSWAERPFVEFSIDNIWFVNAWTCLHWFEIVHLKRRAMARFPPNSPPFSPDVLVHTVHFQYKLFFPHSWRAFSEVIFNFDNTLLVIYNPQSYLVNVIPSRGSGHVDFRSSGFCWFGWPR